MADEKDLELLDDYLSNRMGRTDRTEFEQKLTADPDLQGEYAIQKNLLQGIRDARAAELKAMLNKVPVPSGGQGSAFAIKAIIGAVTIVIAATAYWFVTRDEVKPETLEPPSQQKVTDEQPVPTPSEPAEEEIKAEKHIQKQAAEPDKNQTSAGTEHSRPSLAKKPDPLGEPATKDRDEKSLRETPSGVADPGVRESAGNPLNDQSELRSGGPSFVITTDAQNSRYSFDYQFRDGKLFLYGPFQQNDHEVMEFLTDGKRTVFLHYDDGYYLLKETDGSIQPLIAITDPALLKKLSQYRGK